MEPINRPRLTEDLDRLAGSISALLAPAMTGVLADLPRPIRSVLLAALPVGTNESSLYPMISSSTSRLLALTDDDLAVLVDALAHELGVIRNARTPRAQAPELEAAVAHLREVLSA
jgi:hypothetical protein